MRVSIIGTGYVGLVTGVGLAEVGHTVIGVDSRKEIVDLINKGKSHIFENGLEEKLSLVLKNKKFSATTDFEKAVLESELSMVCVGTPMDAQGNIDLTAVRKVAEQIGKTLAQKKDFHTVVVKSTVLPGTTEEVGRIVEKFSGKRVGTGFGLGMNPEFLREGSAVEDFVSPDRIVLGTNDRKSSEKLTEIYSGKFNAPIVHVNIPTAEMIKYTNNAFLALCISFSNEIAQVCSRVENVDAYEVLNAVSMDRRFKVSRNGSAEITSYLVPGCGFGGSCFPKDLSALRAFARGVGKNARLVEATIEINEAQIQETVLKAEKAVGELKGKVIAVLGTAFKPETDDIRESPGIKIISELILRGAKVRVHDPKALENTQKVFGAKAEYFANSLDALSGAELAIVVTKWAEYKEIRPEEFGKLMKTAKLLDCRRLYEKTKYSKEIEYYQLGKK